MRTIGMISSGWESSSPSFPMAMDGRVQTAVIGSVLGDDLGQEESASKAQNTLGIDPRMT